MARILLLADGSRGDINPFIAVGLSLRAHGHTVRFALTERWAGLATELGFQVDPIPADVPVDSGASFTGQTRILNPIFPLQRAFEEGVLPTLPAKIAALQFACRNADLLVSGALQIPAPIVAERTGIPWASLLVPALCIPSTELNPIVPLRLPHPWREVVNVSAWAGAARLFDQIAGHQVQKLQHAYGLRPRRNVLLSGGVSHQCTIVAISPAFLPRPTDWPPFVHMTDFCFWDTLPEWQPSGALQTFLDSPEPIVAVSSGSWAPSTTDEYTMLYRTSIAAIRRVGARALIVGAPPDRFPELQSSDTYFVAEAPFSYVYPRCTAVIHHGGIGTIAQALRAGVPMVISPLGLDQFFNAAQVAHLGVGRLILRSQYTVDRVSRQLIVVLSDRIRERSHMMARHIVVEKGVADTCSVLEDFLSS